MDGLAIWRDSISRRPVNPRAHYNIGYTLQSRGQDDDAIAHFAVAVQLNPNYVEAYRSMGIILGRQQKWRSAIVCFKTACRLRPDDAGLLCLLGRALEAGGHIDTAMERYAAALALDAQNGEACLRMGFLLEKQGRTADAVGYYRRAIAFGSDHVAALNNLAWILATTPDDDTRNGKEALQLAKRAMISVKPASRGQLLDTLAAAYATCGDFEAAVSSATDAARLAETAGNATLATQCRERLGLYERGEAYLQTP